MIECILSSLVIKRTTEPYKGHTSFYFRATFSATFSATCSACKSLIAGSVLDLCFWNNMAERAETLEKCGDLLKVSS